MKDSLLSVIDVFFSYLFDKYPNYEIIKNGFYLDDYCVEIVCEKCFKYSKSDYLMVKDPIVLPICRECGDIVNFEHLTTNIALNLLNKRWDSLKPNDKIKVLKRLCQTILKFIKFYGFDLNEYGEIVKIMISKECNFPSSLII